MWIGDKLIELEVRNKLLAMEPLKTSCLVKRNKPQFVENEMLS